MPDTTQLGVRIDAKIASLLSEETKKRSKSKKEIIERALLSYLDPASYEKQYGSNNGSNNGSTELLFDNKDMKEKIATNAANIEALSEEVATLRELFATIESPPGSKSGSKLLPSHSQKKHKSPRKKKENNNLKIAGQVQGNRGGKPADLFEYQGKVETLNVHLIDAIPEIDKNSLKNAKINIKRRAKKGTHTIKESIDQEIDSLRKKLKKSS